jgi:hypothetical protein
VYIYIFTKFYKHIYIYIIQIDSRLEVLWNYTPWTRLNLGLALSLENFSPGAGHMPVIVVYQNFFFRSAKIGHILDSSAIISHIFEAIFEDLFKLSSVSEPILGFPTFE